jgi:DNA-binding MarR family transcriptional regulator
MSVTNADRDRASLEQSGEAFFSLLYLQANAVRPVDEALVAAHRTNLTGFELLARLARLDPDGASVRYLADQVVVSPSRVSRMADELVSRGLLERAASRQDGRVSLVRLTDAGREELGRMQETFERAAAEHVFDRLTPKQVKQLTQIGHALGFPHC